MRNNYGFTMAEVLITLGIIGVVAAITLPGLVAAYKDKVYIAQAKKAYSTVMNAINMAKAEEGLSDYTGIYDTSTTSDVTARKILKFMKVTKYCGNTAGCWAKKTKYQYRTNNGRGSVAVLNYFGSTSWAKAVLADGSTIGFYLYEKKDPGNTPGASGVIGDNCLTQFNNRVIDENGNYTGEIRITTDNRCGQIIFDSNGEKGPNQFGADTFSFIVRSNKIVQYAGKFYDVLSRDILIYENYSEGSF